MTKQEILELLRKEEETIVLELLDISSDDLVNAFLDKIVERFEYIHGQYEPQR